MCSGENQVFPTMTRTKATTTIIASPAGSWLFSKWKTNTHKTQYDLLGKVGVRFCIDTAFFPTGFGEAVAWLVFLATLHKSLSDVLAVTAGRGVCLHNRPCLSASYFEDPGLISDALASFL